jgi:3-hydroxyisobutyrate dehydrogenase
MRVAVLGLGRMGTAIATRLADHRHELSVWNRSPAAIAGLTGRGARALDRPADAWAHAEVCLTMLADGDALEAVALGPDAILASADPGGVLIDMSTVSPASSARVAAACDSRGVEFLRAPVSGNPSVVAAGNLGIIVSGPRAAYDRLQPLLHDIGPNVFHVGDGEQARIVKLALNLMIGGTAQLIAEALVLSERYGIERAQMLEVMGASAIGSPFVRYKTDALVADDYRSTFSARLMRKDFDLALEAGRAVELPLPVSALTAQLVQGAIAIGLGDLDFSVLLQRLRREAGLKLPAAAQPDGQRTS